MKPNTPEGHDEYLTLDDALEEARRRRDEGRTRARTAAWPGWKIAVERAITKLAASGREFTSDDVRRLAGEPLGTSPHALGGLIAAAAQRGEIIAVGFRQSTRPAAHARPIRIWRGAS